MSILKNIKEWADYRKVSEQESDRNGYVANITEELGEWIESHKKDNESEKVDALADIVVFSIVEMVKLGYNPDKVMSETLMEINSRIGEWNPRTKKWEKDMTPEAVSKMYKANYEMCKEE